jgi:soluble lytic murein transglycosylase-like protein
MPIDELFQASTDQVLDDRVARPLQAPTVRPSFGSSVWNTVKAGPMGIVSGANKSAAFGVDILNAYGQTQAGIGLQADPTLLFDSAAREKRTTDGQKSRDDLDSGAAFSTELGTNLRTTARSYLPDPNTSNIAESLLFGLGDFGARAIGYTVTVGPVGPVMMGVDEGMSEADRLKAEGVDFTTRTKVGAIAGVVAAAATALPVAGKTVAQTAGLVAAGGPASFMAQQAASKAILEHADYGKIADQYDPFDPVGLAVSTLVPAGFGAYAMRGVRAAAKIPTASDPAAARQLVQMAGNERLALKYDDPRLDAHAVTAAQREGIPPEVLLAIKNAGEKSGPTAVSPAGAKGVMQFMDDTWAAYGKGDPRDPVASIDAGARFMKDLIKQYDGDVRAAIAHYNGGSKAGKAVHAGDLAPALETRKYLGRTDEFLAQHQGEQAGRAAANDPEAVAAARVALVRETVDSSNLHAANDIRGADDHMAAVMRASDQLAGGERVDVSDAIVPERLDIERVSDVVTRVQQAVEELQIAAAQEVGVRLPDAAQKAPDPTSTVLSLPEFAAALHARRESDLATQHAYYSRIAEGQAAADQGKLSTRVRTSPDEARNQVALIEAQQAKLAEEHTPAAQSAMYADLKKSGRLPTLDQIRGDSAAKPTAPKVGEKAGESGRPAGKTSPPDLPAAGESSAARVSTEPVTRANGLLDAQTAEIARLSPDMMVQLEGMDAPMRLSDALEAVKAEAANDVRDAPLLQVAAECFLRNS